MDKEMILVYAIPVVPIVGLLTFGITYAIVQRHRRKLMEQRAAEQYQKWRASMERLGELPPCNIGLRLMSDETGYLKARATLCETRSVRNSTHTGGAIRIAKGITIGRGYSSSESHEEWRAITPGVLYVTNKRIIFDGTTQNRTIKLKDLLSVQAGLTQVAISTTNRQKTMIFDGLNGQIVRDVIEAICDE